MMKFISLKKIRQHLNPNKVTSGLQQCNKMFQLDENQLAFLFSPRIITNI